MNKTKWILCPICGNKTRTMIREDTEMKNFPLYCPKCKKETIINVQDMKITLACAGGIQGKYNGYYFTDISNCYNCGNLVADICGGISGQSAMLHCCYNVGDINGNSKTGALLSEKNETIEYCYYLNTGVDVTGDGGKYPFVKALTFE